MSPQLIRNKQQALKYIEKCGECLLFPRKGYLDLFNQVAGDTVEEKRDRAWRWSDELHLDKLLFLSLAIRGRVTLTSWRHFTEVFHERSSKSLTTTEEKLLNKIREIGPVSTPNLRLAASLPKNLFDRALRKLRQKMLVTVVDIKHETKTKHVYIYDLTERWVPNKCAIGDT
jgi:hypothetical protein